MEENSVRTARELSNPEFNYYLAFKIDLAQTDITEIERTIKRFISNPKGDLKTRRYLQLKDDIYEIMIYDSTYNEQSKVYTKGTGGRKIEAQRAREFKLAEAINAIKTLCKARPFVLKTEIRKIYEVINKPIKYFSVEEFETAVKANLNQGVEIVENKYDDKIPFADYQRIESWLECFDKKDLYDFLGCSHTATADEITLKNNEQYKGKVSLDLKRMQAISFLCSMVQDHLCKTQKARETYDLYLKSKDVFDELKIRRKVNLTYLFRSEYDAFFKKLNAINGQRAEEILLQACKYFKIVVLDDDAKNII